jgi:type IV pilus assembly protein PilE
MRKYMKGVTLVELMVVVVIIAVLMSVAVPSYRQYTIRANRSEGQAMLLQIAANQERWYLSNNTYATNAQLTLDPPLGLGMRNMSESGFYDLAITASDATTFAAVSTAQAGQAADTDCDVLAIDATGRRYAGPGPAFAANNNLDKCW